MSAISKRENLKQAHLDYILLCLSKTSNVEEVKSSFQSFFETGVKPEVIMEVMREHNDQISELRESIPFDERTKGIRIADPIEQLKLLDKLYDQCLEERVVNWNKNGDAATKVEFSVAQKCIDLAHKIRMDEARLSLDKKKLLLLSQDSGEGIGGPATTVEGTPTDHNSGPVVRIIHKKPSKEALEE